MADTECLASGWTFTVGVGATAIGGIDSFTMSTDSKEADTTTFEDSGYETSIITRRSRTVKLTGKFQEDASNGNRDAGQSAVETLCAAVGSAAQDLFAIVSPYGTSISFQATFKLDDIGGGNDDATSWGCTVTRVGADA